jgi:hypothetical protein
MNKLNTIKHLEANRRLIITIITKIANIFFVYPLIRDIFLVKKI